MLSGDSEPEPRRIAEARAPTVQLLGAPCVCHTILQFWERPVSATLSYSSPGSALRL